MRVLTIAIVVLVFAMATASPSVRSAETDAPAVPRNMVSFVAGAECPAGWANEVLPMGRLLVGTDRSDLVGRVVGTALAAVEDRTHQHGLAGATVSLPYKSISAGDGGTQIGAAAGNQPASGTAAPATAQLPYVQLRTCRSP